MVWFSLVVTDEGVKIITIMEQEKNFEQDIITASEGKISNARNPKSIATGIILVFTGIILIISAKFTGGPTSTLVTLFYTVGIISIIAGLISAIWVGKSFRFTPTGSPVRHETLYFETHDLQTLTYLIETGDFNQLSKVRRSDNSGVKIEVDASKDGNFAALQVFHYIPHNYEAASPIYCFYDNQAKSFIRLFNGLKS